MQAYVNKMIFKKKIENNLDLIRNICNKINRNYAYC